MCTDAHIYSDILGLVKISSCIRPAVIYTLGRLCCHGSLSILQRPSPTLRLNTNRVAFQSGPSPAKFHRDDSIAEDQQNLAHTEKLNEDTILRLLEERFRCDIAQVCLIQ